MRCRRVLILAGAFALLASTAVPAPAADDFRAGLRAYNRGEYGQAFRIWYPLAEAGDADAQAGIGFMYHRGLGVVSNDREAAFWLRRGAEVGQAEAQLMLGLLYFYGRGVPQSYVHAFAWCELAQTHGQDNAQECRNAASELLSGDQLQESFALVGELRRQQRPRTR